jgi:hypothetical protein
MVLAETLPFQFVESHRRELIYSAGIWTGVYGRLESLFSPDVHGAIRKNVEDFLTLDNISLPESQVANITSRATSDLSALCFTTARATTDGSMRHSMWNARGNLFDLPAKDAHFIATADPKLVKKYMVETEMMRNGIDSADKVAVALVNEFTAEFARSPDAINTLADMYEEGVAKVDPAFAELKEVIRQDWHSQNPRGSTLRSFLDQLANNPDLFIHDFVDKVVGSENDKRIQSVKNMARFALMTSGMPESPTDLKDVLIRASDSWDSFENIDSLFNEFSAQKLNAITASFNSIAGLASEANPRAYKGVDEVKAFKARMKFNFANREDRRKRRATQISEPIFLRKTIEEMHLSSERFRRDNKEMFYTKRNGATSLKREPLTEDAIREFVAERVDHHVVDDVIACIKRINEDPISQASQVLASGNAQLIIDGKKVKLRRFKPSLSAGLSISHEAARYRICYALIDGSVVIADVLSHDRFDKKYGR